MGYAHYWEDTLPTVDLLIKASAIVAVSTVKVCGSDGTGDPVISETEGVKLDGNKAMREDYESFWITTEYPSSGCKTGHRPYDEVVTAILVHAILTDNGTIKSDGTVEDWGDGINLYERAVRPLDRADREKLRSVLGTRHGFRSDS